MPTQTPERDWVAIYNHQVDSSLYVGLDARDDLQGQEKNIVVHIAPNVITKTRCYWTQDKIAVVEKLGINTHDLFIKGDCQEILLFVSQCFVTHEHAYSVTFW